MSLRATCFDAECGQSSGIPISPGIWLQGPIDVAFLTLRGVAILPHALENAVSRARILLLAEATLMEIEDRPPQRLGMGETRPMM